MAWPYFPKFQRLEGGGGIKRRTFFAASLRGHIFSFSPFTLLKKLNGRAFFFKVPTARGERGIKGITFFCGFPQRNIFSFSPFSLLKKLKNLSHIEKRLLTQFSTYIKLRGAVRKKTYILREAAKKIPSLNGRAFFSKVPTAREERGIKGRTFFAASLRGHIFSFSPFSLLKKQKICHVSKNRFLPPYSTYITYNHISIMPFATLSSQIMI